MATEAQIRANRENAKKSCGPKTDAGKQRSRMNALKHGMRASSLDILLPHEDPAEFKERIDKWNNDMRPTNAAEEHLISQAAQLSWVIDRAARNEKALITKQVHEAMLGKRHQQVQRACTLGRKLTYMAGRRDLKTSGPPWADDPAAFVAELESFSEGAQWLLDRWIQVRVLIISDENWSYADDFKFIRLLGKHPIDAMEDPELNEIHLAWEVISPGWGKKVWTKMQAMHPRDDPGFNRWRSWRELVPRPNSPEEGIAYLRSIADREIDRLQELVKDLEEIEGISASELADQAMFLNTKEGEQIRKFVTARTREFHKALDALMKMRKEAAAAEAAREKATNQAKSSSRRPPELNAVSEEIADILANCLVANIEHPMTSGRVAALMEQTSATEPNKPGETAA